MLVTVVVIVYNHETFLSNTLESVLVQKTDFDFEILVADDASTDGSAKIIKQYEKDYPERIRAIYRTSNIGAQKNIIDSYLKSTGRYIAHLDGDDLMLPNKLQKQIDFFRSHPNCSLVHHKMRVFDSETDNTIRYIRSKSNKSIYSLKDLLISGNDICHSAKMVDTTKFERSDLKPHRNCRALDYLYNVVCVNIHDIGYIDEVLGEYRIHSQGLTSTHIDQRWRFYAGHMRAINAAKIYGVDKQTINRAKSITLSVFARIYLDADHYDKFKKLIERSIKLNKNQTNNVKFHYYLRNFPRILLGARKIIFFINIPAISNIK